MTGTREMTYLKGMVTKRKIQFKRTKVQCIFHEKLPYNGQIGLHPLCEFEIKDYHFTLERSKGKKVTRFFIAIFIEKMFHSTLSLEGTVHKL